MGAEESVDHKWRWKALNCVRGAHTPAVSNWSERTAQDRLEGLRACNRLRLAVPLHPGNRHRHRHGHQQLWIDVRVRCLHAVRFNDSVTKPGVAGETEKKKWYGVAVRSLVFHSRKTGRRRHQVAARLGDDSGGEWAVQPARRWTMEDSLERVLLSAQADTYLRALGSRVAPRLYA